MGIVLARIDYRLIHGIVVTQWASKVKAKRIMVVDDDVAKDEPRKAAMRLSKPAGTGMSLIDIETAITNFNAGKYDNHNVLLVVDNVEVLHTLNESGVEIPKVNIGIMSDSDERTKYDKNFSATDEEFRLLEELTEKGIPVSYQFSPNDNEVPLSKYL